MFLFTSTCAFALLTLPAFSGASDTKGTFTPKASGFKVQHTAFNTWFHEPTCTRYKNVFLKYISEPAIYSVDKIFYANVFEMSLPSIPYHF